MFGLHFVGLDGAYGGVDVGNDTGCCLLYVIHRWDAL